MDRASLDLFGPRAAEVLTSWQQQTHRSLRSFIALDTGGSGALLASVYVRDSDPQRTGRRMIIKLCSPDGESAVEPGRHNAALLSLPRGNESFPEKHLVRQLYDPLPVDDSWLMFQELAGGGDQDMVTLGALRRERRLPDVAADVVRSLLSGWNPDETADSEMTAAEFVTELLDRRLAFDSHLRVWARDTLGLPKSGAPWISLPDGSLLPNPLELADGCPLSKGRVAYPARGRAHGDLHPGNIMVPQEPSSQDGNHVLIDLSRFSDRALLARDPVHLVLCVVADFLPHMSDEGRAELLDLLVGRDTAGLLIPQGLQRTVDSARSAPARWLKERGITAEWRDQGLLSLQACALMFTARERYGVRERWWFYQLAAEAAGAYLRVVGAYVPGRAVPVREPLGVAPSPVPVTGPVAAVTVSPRESASTSAVSVKSIPVAPPPFLAVAMLKDIRQTFERPLVTIASGPTSRLMPEQVQFVMQRAKLLQKNLGGLLEAAAQGLSVDDQWTLLHTLGHLRKVVERGEILHDHLAPPPGERYVTKDPEVPRLRLADALRNLLDACPAAPASSERQPS